MSDFMKVAAELAGRAAGNTFPNPIVGAVLVQGGQILGEGFHRRAGAPHAEVEALRGVDACGATLFVTLEPCDHTGRQAPCTEAVIASGVRHVVVGTMDPNPVTNGRGVARLREAGIRVDVLNDPACVALIEDFAVWSAQERPFVALKMATSLDGFVASSSGMRYRLSGQPWIDALRSLRYRYHAVMVGAGTALIDDPQLFAAPSVREVPFRRIVVAGTRPIPTTLRIFSKNDRYQKTVVLVPDADIPWVQELRTVADVLQVAGADGSVDLARAFGALHELGVCSVLCEGGPTIGARLIAAGLVDRLYWAIAPVFLRTDEAVPVLGGADLASLRQRLAIDSVERVGDDVVISGTLARTPPGGLNV